MVAYLDAKAAAALLVLLGALAGCPAEGGAKDEGGGGGAPGGGGSGGAPGCVDLAAGAPCRWEGAGNGCAADETCSVTDGATCGEASCCTIGTACRARVFGAGPAGFACEGDGDCQGGLCVGLSGQGICLRPCDPAQQLGLCPAGQSCAVVQLDARRSVRTCVGGEEGAFDAARVFCASDRDCPDGRYCLVQNGAGLPRGETYALCVPGVRGDEAGRLCEGEETRALATIGESATGWSDGCAGTGLCHTVCSGQGAGVCYCGAAVEEGHCRAARCTQPCTKPQDCPSPLVCKGSAYTDPKYPHAHEELEFGYCQFPDFNGPDWGCWDETDCCKGGVQRDGAPCCSERLDRCVEAPLDVTVCRVAIDGARYTSRCSLPAGLAAIGAVCGDGAACESGLCVDGVCTSPCDTGRADRCAEIVPGSTCCGARVGEACVRACRTTCDGSDACVP